MRRDMACLILSNSSALSSTLRCAHARLSQGGGENFPEAHLAHGAKTSTPRRLGRPEELSLDLDPDVEHGQGGPHLKLGALGVPRADD